MTAAPTYSNFMSRLLLKRRFENQFVVPEQLPRLQETLMKAFERHFMSIDLSDIEIDRPIFVIALPRTGGSMLQNILCAHHDIAYVTHTMHFFRTCFCAGERLRSAFNLNASGERYLGDSVEVDVSGPADGVALWAYWLRQDPFDLQYVERRASDYSEEDLERMKTDIRKIIWCFGGGHKRFFAKNPGLLPHVSLLAELFPDAKFVHLVRDPRACANSLLKLHRLDNEQLERIRSRGGHGVYDRQDFIPYPRLPQLKHNVEKYGVDDIRTTAHLWNDAVSYVRERRDSLPTFMEVRYEDILARPRELVGEIFEFCELGTPAEDNTQFQSLLSGVGKIRHKNTYGDFEVIEEICGPLMREYGYLD